MPRSEANISVDSRRWPLAADQLAGQSSGAVDAIVRRRRVTMRYASASSKRTKEYVLEPHRVSYADGGMYVIGWVPEYEQHRTFAIERIETLSVGLERFEPRPLPSEPFKNSLGVHTGPTEPVEITFDAAVAAYVGQREWHHSQQIEQREDGSIVMRLEVSVDTPLRSWILSFGSSARVVSPAHLAQEIYEELERGLGRYARRFEMVKMGQSAVGSPAFARVSTSARSRRASP